MFPEIAVSILILCLSTKISADKIEGEGDRCLVKRTGQLGLCINLGQCDYAKELLKNKKWKRPQHCGGFIGIYPLVCCPAPRSEAACQIFHPLVEPCLQPEISGGEKSLAREFPHMAALGYGPKNEIKWLCGGSLISTQFVLTAAHCMNSTTYGSVKWARLGDLDLNSTSDDAVPQDFSIIEFHRHPGYKPPVRYNDIALVKLDRPAIFTPFVKPACLHTELPVPNDLTITGWGTVDLFGDTSNHLLKADIFFVNYTTCAVRYKPEKRLPRGLISDYQMCAGHPEGKDTCPGDSGGPLQYQIHKFSPHFRIVGVTSFGKGCGVGNSIAVYARVSNYSRWIEDIVWPLKEFDLHRLTK